MSSTVQAILGILGALGVLILFLSSSLIANTLNALLSQHLRPIGVMKLVGGRRQQIFTMYIVLILAYCLIALAIAIPLGAQGAYALAAFIAGKMNFNLLGYRLVPLALGIQVIVGLAVPILVGLAPVLNGLADLRPARPVQRPDPRPRDVEAGARLGPSLAAGTIGRGPRPPRHPPPTPAVDVDSQHLSAQAPAGVDAVHPDHGRRHLHRRVQRARQLARVHRRDRQVLPGRCDHRLRSTLPVERDRDGRAPGAGRSRGRGLGICGSRGALGGRLRRREPDHPGAACGLEAGLPHPGRRALAAARRPARDRGQRIDPRAVSRAHPGRQPAPEDRRRDRALGSRRRVQVHGPGRHLRLRNLRVHFGADRHPQPLPVVPRRDPGPHACPAGGDE